MKCQSYGFGDAACTRTRTSSRSTSGLRTSLSSRTSAEPNCSYAIAFIALLLEVHPVRPHGGRCQVYSVHLVQSVGVRRTLVKGNRDSGAAHSKAEVVQMAQQIEAPRRVALSRD